MWKVINLADDEVFWSRLRREVYSGRASEADLERFEGFCANYRASPDSSVVVEGTGQVIGPLGQFPGLEANTRPVHRALEEFDWASKLEAAAPLIRDEYAAYEKRARSQQTANFKDMSEFTDGGKPADASFRRLFLKEGSRVNKANAAHFPATLRILESLDIIGDREVAFNVQAPRTRLKRHSDRIGYLLTGHLGIKLPSPPPRSREEPQSAAHEPPVCGPVCGLEVDGEVREWEEGKVTVIDSTFLHKTWNDSCTEGEERVILHFDFWHPDLSKEERRALTIFKRLFHERGRERDKERQAAARKLESIFR